MITCYIRYVIDPYKVSEFEQYARMWIPLVNRFGGTHHGFLLPYEGPNNVAVCAFSFPDLTAYERYRRLMPDDLECREALALAEASRCILSYERTLMRPITAES